MRTIELPHEWRGVCYAVDKLDGDKNKPDYDCPSQKTVPIGEGRIGFDGYLTEYSTGNHPSYAILMSMEQEQTTIDLWTQLTGRQRVLQFHLGNVPHDES